MASPEAQIRTTLRQSDMADRLALRGEHAHSIEFRGTHSPAAPEIALHIDPKTIWRTVARVNEYTAIAQSNAIAGDVERKNLARLLARFDDIERALVG
ncbi:hypothetical protein LMG28138_02990 [Pararobbsia alpina]|uniref:Uncharacterized protein n=1 Tax=Pararobbsia alpina TaxID=621374 RepID=A0A6S7B757_9BURK|nr:hypothetical protein LMG28138_02990 [Pararobbsia alpina]